MYHPENFTTKELVPPHVHEAWGDSSMRFMSPLLCITIQQLRNKFGRFIANSDSRDRQQSGLRTSEFYEREHKQSPSRAAQSISNSYSMHKFGAAADLIPLDTPLDEIIEYIKANPNEFPFLHFVEVDITWLHVDVRNQKDITFWSPDRGTVHVAEQQEFEWSKHVPHL